ncbi:hypothetical protein Aph02nite_84580 [Actinoplanes philippinensis]|uniref:DUF4034 domain-containing protein n=1 Tax=Actinoplanes philippinensis TaxID=35752 RepID=A0A1I2EPR1_9ACTN|nr:hypothetical protein [Actinoplanes philippinensis]GIE82508.1 hypothetical protein Aph02nite_84580 [Actinoplanes philippinensis]SFE94829.1 hypothetical protein SAMN05421541_104636 [Actinoplanes philippinensis]
MLDRLVVRLSPSAPYPEARALVDRVEAGDWAGCRRIAGEAEPSARTELIRLLGEHSRLGGLAGRALAADPQDSVAAAARAFQLIHQGWQVRGQARARHVSARQFGTFHRYLAEAEKVLHAGLTGAAHDTALWTAALVTARGLQMGLDHAWYRYESLAAFDPHHLPGQSHLLQHLCPKWGGDWAQAEEFARTAGRAAPDGAHNAMLIVDLYLEKWLERPGGRDLSSARARADLHEAADRSVRHPAFRRTVGWVPVVNSFAMAFGLAGERAAAKQMFAVLGPYASEFPWAYHRGGPAPAFRRSRIRAYGLSGGLPSAVDALVVAVSPLTRYVTS